MGLCIRSFTRACWAAALVLCAMGCTLSRFGTFDPSSDPMDASGAAGSILPEAALDHENGGASGEAAAPLPDASQGDATHDAAPDAPHPQDAGLEGTAADAQDSEAGDTGGGCVVPAVWDFESGDQGFTHASTSALPSDDPWQRGAPTGLACHSGGACWKTALSQNYSICQMAQLVSPRIDLSTCTSQPVVELRFWHFYAFEAYSENHWWDGGLVQISANDGTTWEEVTPTPAYQGVIAGAYTNCSPVPDVNGHMGWSGVIPGGGWTQVAVSLPSSYRTATFRFRFLFGSDENTTDFGWAIDDAQVIAK